MAQHLEIELCRKLNKLPKVFEDREINIAHISFGFDNKNLISLLIERGQIITKGAYEKIAAINEKIDKLAEEQKFEIERPVAAFVTFTTQEGFERAINHYGPHSKKAEEDGTDQVHPGEKQILGEDLRCNEAPDPSNIIWQNRHVTRKQQNIRKFFVFIGVVIMLGCSFALFTWFKNIATNNQQKYPPTTDCTNIGNMFTGPSDPIY